MQPHSLRHSVPGREEIYSIIIVLVLRKKTKHVQPKILVVANHMIRHPQVRVLDERGEMLGTMPTTQAMGMAREQDKDLVLVTDKSEVPIAKIIELSKFKYQQQQKMAEGRKKARSQDTKEVRFTPFIGENDLNAKISKVVGFLQKGHKAKLTLAFKGRQIASKELGYEVFEKIFAATSEIAETELPPKMIGNKLIAQLMPGRKKTTETKSNQTATKQVE